MGDIIDLKQERERREPLSPLSNALFELIGACRRLCEAHPYDPFLDEIRDCIEVLQKEIGDA